MTLYKSFLNFLFLLKDFHARSHEGITVLLSPHQFVVLSGYANYSCAQIEFLDIITSLSLLKHTTSHSPIHQALVLQKVDNSLSTGKNLYPMYSAIGFPNTYLLNSDLEQFSM